MRNWPVQRMGITIPTITITMNITTMATTMVITTIFISVTAPQAPRCPECLRSA